MIVRPATDADIHHVVHAMREADAREAFAARWSDDRDELVAELRHGIWCIGPFCFADAAGAAIALIGAWFVADGVAVVNMIATDRWPEIAIAATRWSKRRGVELMTLSVRRAECRVWSEHPTSYRWLESIGFEPEGLHRSYGRLGEHFISMAWINPTPPPS